MRRFAFGAMLAVAGYALCVAAPAADASGLAKKDVLSVDDAGYMGASEQAVTGWTKPAQVVHGVQRKTYVFDQATLRATADKDARINVSKMIDTAPATLPVIDQAGGAIATMSVSATVKDSGVVTSASFSTDTATIQMAGLG